MAQAKQPEEGISKFSAVAQLPTVAVLFATDLFASSVSWLGLSLVGLLDVVTGTTIARLPWHPVRYQCEPVLKEEMQDELDMAATLKSSTFGISPDKLVDLCKAVIKEQFGSRQPDLLADEFQFVAPIVGPLSKKEFVKAYGGFRVDIAFPDQKPNFFGFTVDPQEPNRVWFLSRATSTHTGPLNFNGKIINPTNKHVVHPPQALSMLFDEAGKCYTLTVGYVMDRRIGNTGGLGGLFGPLYAVGHGLPFPEGKPWTPSLRLQALERVQKAARAFGFDV